MFRRLVTTALVVVVAANLHACSGDGAGPEPPSLVGIWSGESAAAHVRLTITERNHADGWGTYRTGYGRLIVTETSDTTLIDDVTVYGDAVVALGFAPQSLQYRSFYGAFKGANEIDGRLHTAVLFDSTGTSTPLRLLRQ